MPPSVDLSRATQGGWVDAAIYEMASRRDSPAQARQVRDLLRSGIVRAARRTPMKFAALAVAILGLTSTASAQGNPPTAAQSGPERFQKDIAAFEAQDKANPPKPGAILLIGDSAFGTWDTLPADLPEYRILNRAVNSFRLPDVTYYANRIITPYKPRRIVVSVGGNDIHYGTTPEHFLGQFKGFVSKIRPSLPDAPIVFVGIVPTLSRVEESEARVKTNRLLSEYARTAKNVEFIDAWSAHLGADGKPRSELWDEKGTHTTHEGFLLRARLMRPFLGAPDRRVQ